MNSDERVPVNTEKMRSWAAHMRTLQSDPIQGDLGIARAAAQATIGPYIERSRGSYIVKLEPDGAVSVTLVKPLKPVHIAKAKPEVRSQ